MLLAVAVAAAYALFNPLRVPGQVIIDDHGAKLKVYPFSRRFGRDHDFRAVAEVIDQCGAHVRRARAGHLVGGGMGRLPLLINGLGLRIGVRAIEQDKIFCIPVVRQEPDEIVLRAPGLGEDDRLLCAAEFVSLFKPGGQRGQERLALGILADRDGEVLKSAQLCDFVLNRGDVVLGKKLGWCLVIDPFLSRFLEARDGNSSWASYLFGQIGCGVHMCNKVEDVRYLIC